MRNRSRVTLLMSMPLVFGIGIGIGAVAGAGAAPLASEISTFVKTIKCSTTAQPCFSASNSGTGSGVTAASAGTAITATSSYDDPFGPAGKAVLAANAAGDADGIDVAAGVRTSHGVASAVSTTGQNGTVYTALGQDVAAIIGSSSAEYIDGGPLSGDGAYLTSQYANGVVGESDNSGPKEPSGVATASAISANAPHGADLYTGFGSGTFEVTASGNVNASGTITAGVTCSPSNCPNGVKLLAYASNDASPTIEDVGRAVLQGGTAVVRLDPAFASTIDAAKDYSVFITPEGESRGLFVTGRTATAFRVRESMGGRSTLAFSYRIVAVPYASSGARLPVLQVAQAVRDASSRSGARLTRVAQQSARLHARMLDLSSRNVTP